MIIEINLDSFSREFSNIEQLAIVSYFIESAMRYDYDAISRRINMQGRTIFSGRGSWRTREVLTDFILDDEQTFRNKYLSATYPSLTTKDMTQLEKKRRLLEESLQTTGFQRWVSEFLQTYSLSWVVGRIITVLTKTRPGITHDNAEFNFNLILEGVR